MAERNCATALRLGFGYRNCGRKPAPILANSGAPRETLNIAYTDKSEHDVFVIPTSSFGFPSDLGISCFDLRPSNRLSPNRVQSFSTKV
jgi:hypothetical protein